MSVRKQTARRILRSLIGLYIAALGQYLTIQAAIGYYPWDVLNIGIVQKTHLLYGTVAMCISIVIVILDLVMKERIGVGSLLDGFLYGYMIDSWRLLGICPEQTKFLPGIGVMLVGLVIIAYGQYFYMSAGLSCGPRDAFLIAVGKRMKKLPIGVVNVLIYIVVMSIGLALGGKVGVGTLIAAFGTGVIIQGVFRTVHFEPRDVVHEDVITTVRKLVSGK